MIPDAGRLAELLKAQAYGLGFDLVGIAGVGPAPSAARFEDWLARGYAGDMEYLSRQATKRRDTSLPFPGARSAVVVGMNYGGTEPSGPVARYARGDDYHDVILARLRTLGDWVASAAGRPVASRPYVDTGPILERDLAVRAGLGWIGKNTNLINPKLGSFFFLGTLLVDLELNADEPFEEDHCGTCARCLDACPTTAFVEPRVLDATRCISYLTIEHRGAISDELRPLVGDLIYGCDVCQDACPWNVRFSRDLPGESPFTARKELGDKAARTLARELLGMSQEQYTASFSRSPMKRAKLMGLRRNAAVALGNVGTTDDVPALAVASADPDPLVAGHAAWAALRIESRARAATTGTGSGPEPEGSRSMKRSGG